MLVVTSPVVLSCMLTSIFPSSNVSVLSEASKEGDEEEEELRKAESVRMSTAVRLLCSTSLFTDGPFPLKNVFVCIYLCTSCIAFTLIFSQIRSVIAS